MTKRKKDKVQAVREIIRRALVYTHPVDPRKHVSRETWIIGKMPHPDLDVDVRLDHGAGQGHAELSLVVDVDGKRVAWEYIDMTTLVNNWAAKVVDQHVRAQALLAAEREAREEMK